MAKAEKPKPVEKKSFEGIRAPKEVVLKFQEGQIINPPSFTNTEDNRPFLIQLSDDEKFRKVGETLSTNSKTLTWENPDLGLHYWRARAKDKKSTWSKPKAMSVMVEPFKSAPAIRKNLRFKSAKAFNRPKQKVKLTWPKIPKAEGYVVDFDNKKYRTKSNSVDVLTETDKKKTFTVTAVSRKGRRQSPTSPPVEVEVRKSLYVPTPRLRSPEDNTAVVSLGSADEFVIFEWTPVRDATEYEVQFSTDSGFANVLFERKVNANSMILDKVLEVKRVYWRVRAKIKDHTSGWSKARTFAL